MLSEEQLHAAFVECSLRIYEAKLAAHTQLQAASTASIKQGASDERLLEEAAKAADKVLSNAHAFLLKQDALARAAS